MTDPEPLDGFDHRPFDVMGVPFYRADYVLALLTHLRQQQAQLQQENTELRARVDSFPEGERGDLPRPASE